MSTTPDAPTQRAKIVCTIGPATSSQERIQGLVEAGMDVARLNFSHGSQADHAAVAARVRVASDATGHAVGLLADLQGPKIRLGTFVGGSAQWVAGASVSITTEPVPGTAERASTTYLRLPDEIQPGQRVLVDDGRLQLEVAGVEGREIRCTVIEGGTVSDRKGLSLPGASLSVAALTEKDADDLRFALGLGVDMIALSFVRSPEDVAFVHAIMDEVGERVPVLAKIEKPEAVGRLDAIIEAFDGVMVARGDLGVELPLEEVPLVQKRAVQRCRELAKPVIVATQMLESMVHEPRPTRAEASDVANAVLDGADALMLSAETSVGEYPIEAVETMARIIGSIEASERRAPAIESRATTTPDAIAASAVRIGDTLGVRAIVAFTQTGDTARRLARHHSQLPVLAFTPVQRVRSNLALSWGVETFLVPPATHTDEMVRQVDVALLGIGRFQRGDSVVIVAGSPPGLAGSTNALRVWTLGSRLPI